MKIQTKILNEIKKHNTIIIHRHKNPDGDAIGSQYGLYLALKENFKDKKIYCVGDINDRCFSAKMDDIDDNKYEGALVFVLDTSVSTLISDERYKKGNTLIIIDHHTNDTDIGEVNIFYKNSSYSSASGIITDFIKEWKLKLSNIAATYLYMGIVTDTGRFLFLGKNNSSQTLESAAFLCTFNPSIDEIYEYLYVEPLVMKKAKAMFSTFDVTKYNVAYRKNTKEIVKASGLDFFSVSRGMVGQMGGIKEIKIWVSFTENEDGIIQAEIRSRGIIVVDIAKKFGGGGHEQACGASLKSFVEADEMLELLNERAKQYE